MEAQAASWPVYSARKAKAIMLMTIWVPLVSPRNFSLSLYLRKPTKLSSYRKVTKGVERTRDREKEGG
jgi:hypothetical protein